MNSDKEVLVLFSGGRDSSSTVIEMARMGFKVTLFTYQAGLSELVGPRGDSAPDIRHKELLKLFPDLVNNDRVITTNSYLIRKLAIERTNSTHVVYPIALALACLSDAVLYCLENNIVNIACGYSGYQAKQDKYIEQRNDFVELTKAFLSNYAICLYTPVISKTEIQVKDILEKNGISSNSLENKSLFGGVPFQIEHALNYWNESLPICLNYINHVQLHGV